MLESYNHSRTKSPASALGGRGGFYWSVFTTFFDFRGGNSFFGMGDGVRSGFFKEEAAGFIGISNVLKIC